MPDPFAPGPLRCEDPSDADVRFLEERLYDFNVATTGIRDGRLLGFFLRDDEGRILAGAAGHTWGGTCELKQVWVAEGLRGRGVGRALLAASEAEARRRGCTQMVLATHRFQAPGFYAKLGFSPVGEFADYPSGHAQVFLRKPLA